MPHKLSSTKVTETTCPSSSETYKVITSTTSNNNKEYYCSNDSEYPSTVKKTSYGSGHMLCASRDLQEGELVAVFRGPIYELEQYSSEELLSDYDKCYVLIYNTSSSNDEIPCYKLLLPISKARYLNHSCEPNCELRSSSTTTTTRRNEVEVYTTKRVSEGEELTFLYNYGEDKGIYKSSSESNSKWNVDLWDEVWSFECQCGSQKCQQRIDRYRQ